MASMVEKRKKPTRKEEGRDEEELKEKEVGWFACSLEEPSVVSTHGQGSNSPLQLRIAWYVGIQLYG